MNRFFTTLLMFIGIGVAVWLGAILLAVLAVVGVLGYAGFYLREYLTEKGILNAQPGVPPEEQQMQQITIIDGDFERIEEVEKQ